MRVTLSCSCLELGSRAPGFLRISSQERNEIIYFETISSSSLAILTAQEGERPEKVTQRVMVGKVRTRITALPRTMSANKQHFQTLNL